MVSENPNTIGVRREKRVRDAIHIMKELKNRVRMPILNDSLLKIPGGLDTFA